MKIHRHITKTADTNLRRARGGVVVVWNDSSTIELTLSIKEIKELEKRFFIDIEDVISDELMGKLLNHFNDEGILLNEEGIRI